MEVWREVLESECLVLLVLDGIKEWGPLVEFIPDVQNVDPILDHSLEFFLFRILPKFYLLCPLLILYSPPSLSLPLNLNF